MQKFYLLFLPLVFIACKDGPQPTPDLEKEFTPYAKIEKACITLSLDQTEDSEGNPLFEKEQAECEAYQEILQSANMATKHMNKNRNNASYYVAKDKYKFEKERLKIQHKHLNLILKDKALDAIDANDLDTFTKIINFSYHPMNISYYRYMQKHIEVFKGHKKMLHFEKQFSHKKYRQGYDLVNKGQYTDGLNELKLAAEMKHIKAAMLCGQTYDFVYPEKAIECYQLALDNGEKKALYYIARGYEENEQMEEAKKWYLQSAGEGNFIAQYKVYELDPSTVNTDKWLKASAQAGYDKAQYEYAKLLMKQGAKKDAVKYFALASKQGHEAAYTPLGSLYYEMKDYSKAAQFLDRGDLTAQSAYMLATLNEKGLGVPKNLYLAMDYYQQAKKLGKSGVQGDIRRITQAKKRLRSRQVKQQKDNAKQRERQLVAQRKKRQEAIQEDKRIRSQIRARKEQAIALKAQACGAEPSEERLRKTGTRIHIEGRLKHWLGKSAFVVVSNGEEYYINDEDDDARVNQGDYINIVAVTTGRRELTQGMRKNLFEIPDERSIRKAYALDYQGICPY